MKEQFFTAILPRLPIVGVLKLTSKDMNSVCKIDVVQGKPSKLDRFFQECFDELERYLEGESTELNIKIDLSAVPPFQLRVLKEMKKIPYGSVATYKDLALKMKSKGYQAIGTACGRNPLMLIYPCHRVIGSTSMGGFAHGLPMKLKLLELEKASIPQGF